MRKFMRSPTIMGAFFIVRSVYEPGITLVNVKVPLPSVKAVGVPTGVTRSSVSAGDQRYLEVARRSLRAQHRTRHFGRAHRPELKSTPCRSSPDPIVTTVARAAVVDAG